MLVLILQILLVVYASVGLTLAVVNMINFAAVPDMAEFLKNRDPVLRSISLRTLTVLATIMLLVAWPYVFVDGRQR